MSLAAVIARNLQAQRQGHNWRCECLLNCGYAMSLADGEDGQLLAHCFGGCGFNDIIDALVERGLLDEMDGVDPVHTGNGGVPHHRDEQDETARIARAIEIYSLGGADERIGIYLSSRSITISSPVLRFSEQAPHRLGAKLPAMLSPITNVRGEQIGTHMTFLRHDGRGKADLPKEFQRECRGVIRGGAIRLATVDHGSAAAPGPQRDVEPIVTQPNGLSHDPEPELIIGEGIETTLSAMEIFGLPGWSAVYAGGLKTVELPPAMRRIVIAADNDASGAGQRNAVAAYERWTAEGRSAHIMMPSVVGDDFNNVLVNKKRQG